MANLSISPGVLHITAMQGKTWSIVVTVKDSAGQLFDLTGYSARWQVRSTVGTKPVVLDLQVGSGITIDPAGLIQITATPEQTAAINPSNYRHEIELVEPDGTVPPFLAGNLLVQSEVVK